MQLGRDQLLCLLGSLCRLHRIPFDAGLVLRKPFLSTDKADWDRQVGVGAMKVELADSRVRVAAQPVFQVGDHALVAEPGADLAPRPVGPEFRDHQVRRQRREPPRPQILKNRPNQPSNSAKGRADELCRRLRGARLLSSPRNWMRVNQPWRCWTRGWQKCFGRFI